jgi:hypothetical protein
VFLCLCVGGKGCWAEDPLFGIVIVGLGSYKCQNCRVCMGYDDCMSVFVWGLSVVDGRVKERVGEKEDVTRSAV